MITFGFRNIEKMAFTFGAFTYITALIVDAFLLFFSIFHVSTGDWWYFRYFRFKLLAPCPYIYKKLHIKGKIFWIAG